MTVRRFRIAVIPPRSRSPLILYACITETYSCMTLASLSGRQMLFLSHALRITVNFKYILGITVFMKDIITIRGERDLWLDFIHKAKKEKKKVWDVLSPFLRKYISCDEESRVLLILFPERLVDQILNQEDPDEFIEEAIQNHFEKKK